MAAVSFLVRRLPAPGAVPVHPPDSHACPAVRGWTCSGARHSRHRTVSPLLRAVISAPNCNIPVKETLVS